MTNGEMIQKIFNCEVCEPIIEEDIIHVIFPDKNDSAIGFDWSWWVMEYKEPTTKIDLGVDVISKADYENRLKADLKAILTEIQLELDEMKITKVRSAGFAPYSKDPFRRGVNCSKEIIQQKINELKAESEG